MMRFGNKGSIIGTGLQPTPNSYELLPDGKVEMNPLKTFQPLVNEDWRNV
jgi:hypothetical protein